MGALNPLKTRTTIPEHLLLPTYQNQLRIIGRHLDMNDYRAISVLDVEGGILVRASTARRHESELLEFPDNAFVEMVRDAIKARGRRKKVNRNTALVPTGYEDLLRALGYELDQRLAKSITLHEGQQSLYVAGLAASKNANGTFSPFDMALTEADIQAMLDAAFRRRA
jgi:hypothetical protein